MKIKNKARLANPKRIRRLGEFVQRFAEALPGGVDVTEDMVSEAAPDDRNAFLRWLRKGCPTPKAVAAWRR